MYRYLEFILAKKDEKGTGIRSQKSLEGRTPKVGQKIIKRVRDPLSAGILTIDSAESSKGGKVGSVKLSGGKGVKLEESLTGFWKRYRRFKA